MTAQLDMLNSETFIQRAVRQFDELGRLRKENGLLRVELKGSAWLRTMREKAQAIAVEHGSVTTDELRLYADQTRQPPHHDNCWGAVFRGPRWVVIGRRQSRWPSCHAREIKIWRYVGPVA